MIKKIPKQNTWGQCLDKIDEIVDAVNDITDWIKRTDETIVKYGIKPIPEKIAQGFKNLQDPYAEQRKWIGKLCRFWNFKDGEVDIGILKAVDNLKPTIPYINDIDCSYAYCEPVKPDDDIIYNGDDK